MPPDHIQKAFEEGDIETGLALYHAALPPHPNPAQLLELLHLLTSLYRIREALEISHQLLNHPAANATHLLPAARLLFSKNQIKTSSRLTAQALQLDPQNPDLTALHASNLERTNQRPTAKLLLTSILQNHPAHLRSIRLLAHLEHLSGNLQSARQLLDDRLAGPNSAEDWRLAYELAPILEKLGEPDQALEMMDFAKSRLHFKAGTIRKQWHAIAKRQWDLTLQLDHDRLTRWSTPIAPAQKICLLAGFPRSGTTLLERILTTHPACLGTDESGILKSQFRDPLILMASSTKDALAELDQFTPQALQAGRAEYLRATSELLGEQIGARLLIEKEPLLTSDLAVPLRLFPEAKILMPIRDPRDVVISFYFTIVPTAAHSIASATLEDSCRYYAETMRHWLYLKEVLPPHRWLESRYEDLLDAPEATTKKITSFLDLPWSPDLLDHTRREASRAISTPTYADVERPLYSHARARWMKYRRHLEPHLHLLRPFLKEFGYQE